MNLFPMPLLSSTRWPLGSNLRWSCGCSGEIPRTLAQLAEIALGSRSEHRGPLGSHPGINQKDPRQPKLPRAFSSGRPDVPASLRSSEIRSDKQKAPDRQMPIRDSLSGRPDSNRGPPQPHCGALPDCATSRHTPIRWGIAKFVQSSWYFKVRGGKLAGRMGVQGLTLFRSKSNFPFLLRGGAAR